MDVPPELSTSGWDPGSSTARFELTRAAVLRALVAGGGDHGLPLQGHAGEDRVLRLRVSRADQCLAVAPARGHDLRDVVAGDPVEEVEGLHVVVVRRLVDDQRRRRRVEGGHLGVERRLPLALGWATGAAVDDHVADGARQAVAGLERLEVAREVLLELHDGDRLADPGAPLGEHLVEPEDGGELRRGVRPPEGLPGGGGARLRCADVGHGVALRRTTGRAGRRGRRRRPLRSAPGSNRRPPVVDAGAGRTMACSWARPSNPTTAVTDPARAAGICGDAVFTREGDSSGACTDSSGVEKAADTTAAVPLTGSRVLPGSGVPTVRPSARSADETCGDLGRAGAVLGGELGRREVVAVVG